MPLGKYPAADQWNALDSLGQCQSLAVAYLGGETYPEGKYKAASLDPTPEAWLNGQHYAWCGVTLGSSSTGALFPISVGSAEGVG
jgi:hypothetical protein